jgi:hypothetical protein
VVTQPGSSPGDLPKSLPGGSLYWDAGGKAGAGNTGGLIESVPKGNGSALYFHLLFPLGK